jgi:hypothetical protein
MQRLYIVIFILACMIVCCKQNPMKGKSPNSPIDKKSIDTVSVINSETDSALAFKAPNGKLYNVSFAPEVGDAMTASRLDCTKDDFLGEHRKAAKTSIASGSAKVYTGFTYFFTTLQADSFMERHRLIKQTASNNRVPEEMRNVKLIKVFLYAIKREDDNDYHLILGDNKGQYLTAETSGLPVKGSSFYNRLEKSRNQLKEFFGPFCISTYRKFQPAIPVEVTGSLFYDKDHDAGAIGPVGMRPKTAWEIHPITNIVFK